MSQERILKMLSNDSYLQVKNIEKRCKISTAGSKIDIIMRLKSVLTRDEEKFNKIFIKMWGHSGGWMSFSCPHSVVYYLKFLLRAESCRNYVDGCLSMAYLPNVVVVDMAHIVSKHANRSRREDIEKYNKGDNEGKLFRPYDGRAADPEIKDNVKKANDGTLSVSFPWMPNTSSTSKQSDFKKDAHPVTGSDAHLCLFDKFHECNSSSEIEALRRSGNIPELNGLFNS